MQPDWTIIEQENEDLVIRSSRMIGEGWNCLVYLVNDELVFRFPKRSTHWPELERETAFLAWATDRLSLPVPQYIKVAPDSLAAPSGYAAYRYLSGSPLDLHALSTTQQDAAADAIARFLREMHELEPAPELAEALPRENPRSVAEACREAASRGIVPRLDRFEGRRVLAEFDSYLDTAENFTFEPRVLHADLGRDHLVVKDGSVVGVIDFGDINWGDPDYDFMYMFVDFGDPFVDRVARHYGHKHVARLKTKVRYLALADQVDTIVHGAGVALDGQEQDAWRRIRQFAKSPAGV